MDPRLSIIAFPQRFDGAELALNILVVPRLSPGWNGSPLAPLVTGLPAAGDTTPAFADADLQLSLSVQDGLDRFPASTTATVRLPLPDASGPLPDARALFTALADPAAGGFTLAPTPPRLAPAVDPRIFIKKYLPQSYRDSFLFTGPRVREAVTDDSYACAMKRGDAPNPAFVSTPDGVSWGQVYAFCLRQPLLARRLGLIRSARVALPDGILDDGGFVWIGLTRGSDYQDAFTARPDLIKRHAARVPALVRDTARTLFAAVVFPVLVDDPAVPGLPPAPGNYDAPFREAADFDDGFAKIVHAAQPVSQNLIAETADGFAPLTDIGIRLGWDDEQILIWQNRQLREDPTVPSVPGERRRLDAPSGVFGWRIDARQAGDADWHSLVAVAARAPITFAGTTLAPRFAGELAVEVHPMQLDGNQATGQFWLPPYLAQWSGTSLVLPDLDAAAIFQTIEATTPPDNLTRLYAPTGLDAVPLRYGRTYDLRVRLVDPTGGGPDEASMPVHDAPAPVATVAFRRHVRPEPPRLVGPAATLASSLDAPFAGDSFAVTRPLLGYPSVVFTGKYADPVPLLVAASVAAVGKENFGIADPDVIRIRIDVELRTVRMDNLLSISGREAYVHLYSTERVFPADFDASLEIPFDFRDAHVLRFGDPTDFGDLAIDQAGIDAADGLPLPTARDIRLTVRGVGDDDPAYFASGAATGKPVQLVVRREAASETGLIAATGAARKIRGIYLQPGTALAVTGDPLAFVTATASDEMIERFAEAVGVDHRGMTLMGRRGERVVFGASRGLRHTLAPDHSSITLAAADDLINHWIVPLTLQLDRDWTWDGLAPVSFDVLRTTTRGPVTGAETVVGDIEVVATVPLLALDSAHREATTLVFLDTVEPDAIVEPAVPSPVPVPRRPEVITVSYRIVARYRQAGVAADPPELLALDLPATTRPHQVPRITSAGIALSPYRRSDDYATSEARRRSLWLEFEAPATDPRDTYFIRLLGYAPDPLLSDARLETFVPRDEPGLPIDPEPIRTITPGQSDDLAGLAAMVPLEMSIDGTRRHFLVPLPPGLNASSPELFGFFTYEFRIGHATLWSTAQGRFGRPLRATGIQHPAPTLYATCQRLGDRLYVEAPFAQAVLNGKNITADPPRSQLWALLYAQVRQADGKDSRNILLDDRRLDLVPRRPPRTVGTFAVVQPLVNRDAPRRGAASWTAAEIAALLLELGLPAQSPLSVVVAEMMPTAASLRLKRETATGDVAAMAFAERTGAQVAGSEPDDDIRPLSDQLGHHRILRTSPLTKVPAIC